MKKFYAILVWILLCYTNTFSNFQFEIYSSNNGLETDLTKKVFLDSKKLLWIASDNGLLLFDGKNFRFLFKNEIKSYVKDIAEVHNELIVTSDQGIFRLIRKKEYSLTEKDYQLVKFVIPDSIQFYPKDIYLDKNNVLWIGKANGLLKIDSTKVKDFILTQSEVGESYNHVFSFYETESNLWAISQSGYLFQCKNDTLIFKNAQLHSYLKTVENIVPIKNNVFYASGAFGLVKVSLNEKNSNLQITPLIQNIAITCLVKLDSTSYLLGTETQGLYIWNPEQKKITNVSDFPLKNIKHILKISDKIFVVASDEGIAFIVPKLVEPLIRFSDRYIKKMIKVPGAVIYSDGLSISAISMNQKNELIKNDILNNKEEESLILNFALFKNILAVARWGNDIKLYRILNNKGQFYKKLTLPTNKDVYITSLAFDKNGILWVVNRNEKKLYAYIRNHWKIYDSRNGLNNIINFMEMSPQNVPILGLISKQLCLSFFDSETEQFNYRCFNSSKVENGEISVNDLLIEKDKIYTASSEGIYVFSSDKIIKKIFPDWIENNFFSSINTLNGICVYGGKNGIIIEYDNKYIHIDSRNGLNSNKIVDHGILFLNNDNMLVGTSRGLGLIHLKQIKSRSLDKPAIASMKLNNSIIQIDTKSFPFHSTLELTLFSNIYPAKNLEYSVLLMKNGELLKKIIVNGNTIILPAMAAGDYQLKIIAQASGYLNSDPLNLYFHVKNPFYLQTWFLLLGILFFLIIFYLLHQLYVVRKKIKEKDRSLKELGEKFSFQISKAPIGYVEWDNKMQVVKINYYMEKILNINSKEFPLTELPITVENAEEDKLNQLLNEIKIKPKTIQKVLELKNNKGEKFYTEWIFTAIFDEMGNFKSIVALIIDLTKRIEIEKEKERLIEELQEALANVKELKGLIPICANCKKVRDDSGYWESVEVYVSKHSDADFSHSLCPECAAKLYPEIYGKIKKDKSKDHGH